MNFDRYIVDLIVPSDVDSSELLAELQTFACDLLGQHEPEDATDEEINALVTLVENETSVTHKGAYESPLTDAERADMPAPYFTVVIPWVPSTYRTEWHPLETDKGGPFETLTRGNFPTIDKAIEWAQTKLGGTPYSIKPIGFEDRNV